MNKHRKPLFSTFLIAIFFAFPFFVNGQICDSDWLQNSGLNAGIRIGDLDIPGHTLTVEATFNRTAPYAGSELYAGDIVSKHRDFQDANYLLRPNTAEITTTNGYFRTPDICDIELNKTYHVAMVYDGSSLKFYRNGFLMSEVAATGDLIQNDWITTIGDLAYQPGYDNETLIGHINEVRIWNVTRSQNEIKQYLNKTLPNPSSQVGLRAYYTFNDLKNKQGDGSWDGTLVGNATILNNNPTCSSYIADSCGIIPCAIRPVVNGGKDTSICEGASVQLNASGTLFYTWSSSFSLSDSTISNPIASPNFATQFIVEGYDQPGCFGTDTVTIFVSPPPIISLINDTAICSGLSVALGREVNSENTYTWSPTTNLSNPSISNPIAKPTINTKYRVKATSRNNCVSTDSLTVTVFSLPDVSTIDDTAICAGSSITLNTVSGSGQKFSWSPVAALTNTNSINPVASPLATTKYIVTATSMEGCSSKDSVVVNVLPLPSVVVSNDTLICAGKATTLTASSPDAVQYSWFPSTGLNNSSIQNPIASPNTSTNYYVQVTASNGCKARDSVVVDVRQKPVFTLNPLSIGVCSGKSTVLTASGGDTYQWTPATSVAHPNDPSTAVFPSANTTYKVVIIDNVCKVTDSLFSTVSITSLANTSVNKSNDVDCVLGQAKLTANGGVKYLWSPALSLSNPNVANPVATPTETTTYYVQISNATGCSVRDSIQVKVFIGEVENGYLLPSAFTPNNDGDNDCFGIKKWGSVTGLDFSIYNRWGNLVFHTNNSSDCWNGTFKGILQPSGSYVYEIRANTICGNVYRKGTVVLLR